MSKLKKALTGIVVVAAAITAINVFDYQATMVLNKNTPCKDVRESLEEHQARYDGGFLRIGYIGRGNLGGELAYKAILEERCQ